MIAFINLYLYTSTFKTFYSHEFNKVLCKRFSIKNNKRNIYKISIIQTYIIFSDKLIEKQLNTPYITNNIINNVQQMIIFLYKPRIFVIMQIL